MALNNPEFPNAKMYVTGVKFTPQNAYLTLIGVENDQSNTNGGMSISAATAISSTPYGVKHDAYLVPLKSASSGKVNIIPAIQKSISASHDSRIYCDCNGYGKSDVKEILTINPDLLELC